jgi:hypothetical protein
MTYNASQENLIGGQTKIYTSYRQKKQVSEASDNVSFSSALLNCSAGGVY